MSVNFTQDFVSSRRNYNDGTTRVGQKDRLWYDSVTNSIRVSDGVTPGGIPVGGGSGGVPPGSNISLFNNDAGYINLNSLSATGDLTYNSTNGQFSVTTYKSTNFDADLATKTTDDLTEGSVNLYFTDGRVAAVVQNTSIAELLDVDSDLVVNLQEDSILIYNAINNIFIAESFLSVLDRLKAELEVQYDRLVDEEGPITYVGEAAPGSDRSEPVWRIKRIEELAGENAGDIEILWAGGSAAFDKVWNLRDTYIY
jgi:hypothetical protein